MRDVLVEDELEGVGAFDSLNCVGGVRTNSLAEATEFVGVWTTPDLFGRWMVAKLEILYCLASGYIDDIEAPVVDEVVGILVACSCVGCEG